MENFVLSRYKRSTNGTTSSSDDDVFSDANKLAMYVVVPILFLVYGGCACIYCCYRCRQYFKENKPLEIIKLKLKRKNSVNVDINENRSDELFRSANVPTSARSSPGGRRSTGYDPDSRSNASTPGLHYAAFGTRRENGSNLTINCQVHNEKSLEIEDIDDSNIQEDDSGIQGDSMLTDSSPTSYLIERFVSEMPRKKVTVLPYVSKINEVEGGNDNLQNTQSKVFTVDCETQTDPILGMEPKSFKRSTTGISSRYLEWRDKHLLKKSESKEMLLMNSRKQSFNSNESSVFEHKSVSPYSNNQIHRDADAWFKARMAIFEPKKQDKAKELRTSSIASSSVSSRRNRKEILDQEDLRDFIIAPWK